LVWGDNEWDFWGREFWGVGLKSNVKKLKFDGEYTNNKKAFFCFDVSPTIHHFKLKEKQKR